MPAIRDFIEKRKGLWQGEVTKRKKIAKSRKAQGKGGRRGFLREDELGLEGRKD